MEILIFKTPKKFREWLEKNHTREEGILLRLFRKNSGIKSITYQEALDEALCFGWIDGQVKKDGDINSWTQRFTHRRKGSLWSKRNVENAERLIKNGRMMPSGLEEIEKAKADGRWESAYGSHVNFTLPEDFILEVRKSKKAQEFLEKLNKSNQYAIYWRLHTAKRPETREKWKKKFLEMLSKGEKIQ